MSRRIDLRAVPFHAAFGAFLGFLAGLAECLSLLAGGGSVMTVHGLLPVTLFYVIVFTASGTVLGVASAVLRGGRPAWAAVQVLLTLVVTVGVLVNMRYLPAARSPVSLAFDGVFLVGLAALFRPLRAWLAGRRRLVPVSLGVTAVGLLGLAIPSLSGQGGRAAGTGHPGGSAPNVIVLVVDALRAREVPAYGYPRARTPNLDRFARNGLVFERMITQGARTKESTASILTGVHASRHGMTDITSALRDDQLLLPEMMQRSGYATSIYTANSLVSPLFGYGRGVDLFYSERRSIVPSTLVAHLMMKLGYRMHPLYFLIETMWWLRDRLPSGAPGTAFAGNDAGDINAALLDWLGKQPDVPHFVYVHYMEAHAPYDPPAPWDILYDRRGRELHVTDPPRGAELSFPLGKAQPLSDDELASVHALYDGEIAYWDHRFGALLRGLDDLGIRNNTLVLVTADHGEEFYEHGCWEHGNGMYDELIHVPLIAQWPGHVHGPRIDRGLAQHIDLFPTALAVAGTSADGLGLPGASLVPRLDGAGQSATRSVLTEVFDGGFQVQSLRTLDSKYIRCISTSREHSILLDLKTDPAELRDVSATMPAVNDSLAAEFDSVLAAASVGGVRTEGVTLDPETEEHLRALGYIK